MKLINIFCIALLCGSLAEAAEYVNWANSQAPLVDRTNRVIPAGSGWVVAIYKTGADHAIDDYNALVDDELVGMFAYVGSAGANGYFAQTFSTAASNQPTGRGLNAGDQIYSRIFDSPSISNAQWCAVIDDALTVVEDFAYPPGVGWMYDPGAVAGPDWMRIRVQSIVFPPIPDQIATNTLSLTATASSALTVSFTIAGGPARISGGTNLTFTGSGKVSIVASQAGDANWNPAPDVTNTFNVSKANQTITFPAIPDQVATATVGLCATAASGLRVSFAVGSGPGLITRLTNLTFTGTGSVSIVASQAGNAIWNAAPTVLRKVKVIPASSPVSGIINADFDGDGLADPSIYDARTGTWTTLLSSAGYLPTMLANLLGGPGYVPAAADFDGDKFTDPGVYGEATGEWIVLLSSANYYRLALPEFLGGPGQSPCPADYDGDRKAEPAVYTEATGDWDVMLSSAGYDTITLVNFLGGAGDTPCPADYDGDKLADPAVYAETTGDWIVLLSRSGYLRSTLPGLLGGPGFLPVPADYDGDGLADPAVRKSDGSEWRIMLSGSGYELISVPLGL